MKKKNNINDMYAIAIYFDNDACEELQEENGKEFIAFKNDEYGIGAFVSEDMEFGVYGDDMLSKDVISIYCDIHEDQIKEALCSATSMDELCGVVSRIVADCVMEIEKIIANAA